MQYIFYSIHFRIYYRRGTINYSETEVIFYSPMVFNYHKQKPRPIVRCSKCRFTFPSIYTNSLEIALSCITDKSYLYVFIGIN